MSVLEHKLTSNPITFFQSVCINCNLLNYKTTNLNKKTKQFKLLINNYLSSKFNKKNYTSVPHQSICYQNLDDSWTIISSISMFILEHELSSNRRSNFSQAVPTANPQTTNLQTSIQKTKNKPKLPFNYRRHLDDVLRGRGPVVERRPLQRVVAELVGLGDGAGLPLHQPLQLVQVPVRRRRVHIIPLRLLPAAVAAGGLRRAIVDDLDLGGHGGRNRAPKNTEWLWIGRGHGGWLGRCRKGRENGAEGRD